MPNNTVLHVALDYGLPSETFVADAVEFTETGGWTSWLLSAPPQNREWFPFPPDERIAVAKRPPLWWRVFQRLRLSGDADRTARMIWPKLPVRPDVVHAHFGWAALFAAEVAERVGAPLVTTFHASDLSVYPHLHGLDRALGRLQGRNHRLDRTLGRVDCAIAVSDWVADDLTNLGYTGRIERLPVGIRLDHFTLRDAAPAASPKCIAFTGRLTERKGVDVLIRAVARARDELGACVLEIAGDGPLRGELEQLAQDSGVRAVLHGAVPPDVVAEMLGRAHVFAMTSRTLATGERESGPMVLKEAMAVGVPVIATDSGGTRAILPPEFRDEAVAEDDVAALADRLVSVLGEEPAQATARVQTGRRWVESEFDVRTIGTKTTAIYDSLLPAGSPSGTPSTGTEPQAA